jgi:hypothetical protein
VIQATAALHPAAHVRFRRAGGDDSRLDRCRLIRYVSGYPARMASTGVRREARSAG